MEDKQDGGPSNGPDFTETTQGAQSTIDPRDGRTDFSNHTLEQLKDLLSRLDPDAFPVSSKRLRAEIERRSAASQSTRSYRKTPLHGAQPVRFTPGDGWRGWLHALLRRMPLYGRGTADITPGRDLSSQQLKLEGWQRSWRGRPEQVLVSIGLERVRNAVREHHRVLLMYEQPYFPPRPVELEMGSAEAAQHLMDRLPPTEPTPGLARWLQKRKRARRLQELTPRPWVTSALLLAMVTVYLLTVLAAQGAPPDAPVALDWGASFGPLTLNGQWWRLLAAAFLSWTPAQLLIDAGALWSLGRTTERLYGSWTFLVIYLASAVAGSAVSLFWDPSVISLGASGALWGVLGALTVFVLRRHRELPAGLWRSHAPGTLLLLTFTGMSIFINTGVDLAACAGGALCGLGAGSLLQRAPKPEARRFFPFAEALAVTMLTPGVVTLLLWQTIPQRISPVEAYFRQHESQTRSAGAATARWQELLEDLHRGRISDQELQQRFQAEILPFWRDSAQSLQQEVDGVPEAQRRIAALHADLARLRRSAAESAIAAQTSHDPDQVARAQQLSLTASLTEAQIERVQLRITMSYRARGAAHSVPLMALQARTLYPGCAEAALSKAGCNAQRLFLAGDYARLEALIEHAAAHLADPLSDVPADVPGGGSALAQIDAGLTELFASGDLPLDEALTRTAGWQRQLPASRLPDLVEARIFQAWAWQARAADPQGPNGETGQTDPANPTDAADRWLLAAGREAMAADSLTDARAHGTPGPLWYATFLAVNQDRGTAPEKVRGMFNEGIRRFPQYMPLYREMLRLVVAAHAHEKPGAPENADSLIRDVSQAHAPTNLALYARLYLIYGDLLQDEVNIYTGALAQWSLMKAGLGELRRQYPDNDYLLNVYAKSACDAGDLLQYAAVRPKLDARFAPDAWSARTSLAVCDDKMKRAHPDMREATASTVPMPPQHRPDAALMTP